MKIILKQCSQGLEIVEVTGSLPPGQTAALYTEDELQSRIENDLWAKIPSSTRETMALQAQAKSYQSWMEEDEWDAETRVEESADGCTLADFQP